MCASTASARSIAASIDAVERDTPARISASSSSISARNAASISAATTEVSTVDGWSTGARDATAAATARSSLAVAATSRSRAWRASLRTSISSARISVNASSALSTSATSRSISVRCSSTSACEADRFGPGPYRRFLRGDAALLGPAECGGGVEAGAFGFGRADRRQCVVDPSVGPLQPQPSDIVDQFGRRAHGDPTPEHVVGLDRSAQAAERTRGHPRFAEERPQLVGHSHRQACAAGSPPRSAPRIRSRCAGVDARSRHPRSWVNATPRRRSQPETFRGSPGSDRRDDGGRVGDGAQDRCRRQRRARRPRCDRRPT